jgi:translocation and assembly module TamB
VKRIFKISLYIVGTIIGLIVVVILFLLSPPGQRFVTKQTISFISNKINTPFTVGEIKYKLPTSVGISDLLLIDQNNDTLAYLHTLDLKVNMFKLLSANLSVNSLDIDGAYFYMHRKLNDSTYNFQYIIDAFTGSGEKTEMESSVVDTATKNNFNIDVVKTHLKNVTYRLHDESGGIDFYISLEELLLRPNTIDLSNLKFDVEELSLKGVNTKLVMYPSSLPATPDTSTSKSSLWLTVNKLQLDNIEYVMDMKESPLYMKVNLGQLESSIKEFDLFNQNIDVSKLYLYNTNAIMVMGKSVTPKEAIDDVNEVLNKDSLDWRIKVDDIKFKNIGYTLDNNNQPIMNYGMDYAHMDINRVYLVADNLLYTNDTISGSIKQLTLQEKSGVELEEFKTDFVYSNQGAVLDNFILRTPRTVIQDKLAIYYPSLEELSRNLGSMGLNINLGNSILGMDDVLLFVPESLRSQLNAYRGQKLDITASLNGLLKDLKIDKLYASGLNSTIIDLSGTLKGLPDSKALNFSFSIAQLQTSNKDIDAFLTDSIKMVVNIPNKIMASGSISGTTTYFKPNLKVLTSDGNAFINGSLALEPNGKEQYDLYVQAINLNLGKIIKQDSSIGAITSNIKVKGSSFDIKKMNTDVDLDIFSAYLLGYNYNDIKGKVNLQSGRANANIIADDENLKFTLIGSAFLDKDYPDIDATMHLNKANLHALNFAEDTLQISGIVEAKLPDFNLDYPKGCIIGSDLEMVIPYNKLPLDSIIIVANSNPIDGQNIAIDIAKMLNLNISGSLPLTKVPNAYLSHINRYYNFGDTSNIEQLNYNLLVDGTLSYNPILNRFDRKIRPFDTLKLSSSINESKFDLDVWIPNFRYDKHVIDSGFVRVDEASNQINYYIGTKLYDNKSNIKLYQPSISGKINNDTIQAKLTIKDSLGVDNYLVRLAANKDLTVENSNINIRLFKGLMIDKDLWQINESNKITLNGNQFKIRDFFISQNDQRISINSVYDTFSSPLAVDIKNLRLGSISKIINKDTLPFDGILNTDIEVDLNHPIPFVKGDATVDNFELMTVPFGNIRLNATTQNATTYNTTLTLNGAGNDIALKGDYHMKPVNGNDFTFNLKVNPLSLKSIEALTYGNLKNSQGNLTGNLDITGTIDKPSIIGNITINNVVTTVDMINGKFSLPQEKINFTKNGIEFNNFNIYDYRNQKAQLDGRIRTKDF